MKLSGFLAFTLLSISILSFGLTGAVNAQSDLPLSVSTDATAYTAGNSILISGTIKNLAEYEQPVVLMVVSPDGNIVTVQQVMPDSSGNYSVTITAGGTMNSSGEYEIRAQYGAQKITSTFQFIAGDAPVKVTPTPVAEPTPEPVPEPTTTNYGMSVTATAAEGGNIITINGETTSNITDVTIRVISPNGSNNVGTDQVTPNSNGEFSTEFNVSNWQQDGMYKIKANQGTSLVYRVTLSADVTNGMTAETSTTESSIVSPYTIGSTNEIQGLFITANAMQGSDIIGITGHTNNQYDDVSITVTSPNGNLMSVDQTSPNTNGDFTMDISVGGSLWSQDGTYTVTAQQGNDSMFEDLVEFRVMDGLTVQ